MASACVCLGVRCVMRNVCGAYPIQSKFRRASMQEPHVITAKNDMRQ